MTSDVTDLETSKRLAKAWPADDKGGEHTWWLYCSKGYRKYAPWRTWTGFWCSAAARPEWEERVRAYTLSELEAEIKRMGLCIRLQFIPLDHEGKDATVAVALYHWNIDSDRLAAETTSNTIINALGNAVAEAKEKR